MTRTPTTEMEVTSIRFERELKDKLKELAGSQGYQSLVREILWDYVKKQPQSQSPHVSLADIRATFSAIAQREEICHLTGTAIQPQEPILLGLMANGQLVPLKADSLD